MGDRIPIGEWREQRSKRREHNPNPCLKTQIKTDQMETNLKVRNSLTTPVRLLLLQLLLNFGCSPTLFLFSGLNGRIAISLSFSIVSERGMTGVPFPLFIALSVFRSIWGCLGVLGANGQPKKVKEGLFGTESK